jgi:hypothetical protein
MTTRPGRKPLGPELVEHLLGSDHAKGRLKIMLETLRGEKSVPEACAELSLGESRFHELRVDTLQAALDRLEPRPAGRPSATVSPEQARLRELEREVRALELQRDALVVRLELAQALPAAGRPAGASSKKRSVS